MQPTERKEFDAHLATLCAGFNVPLTPERSDAYWRGLAKMRVSEFARSIEHALGEDGPEKIPTVPQIWTIHRKHRVNRVSQPVRAAEPVGDNYDHFGNRMLLTFLLRKQGTSEAALQRMVTAKNNLMSEVREFERKHPDEPFVSAHIEQTLHKAFEREFESTIDAEIEAARNRFTRTGYACKQVGKGS